MKFLILTLFLTIAFPLGSAAQDPCAGRKYIYHVFNPDKCEDEGVCTDSPNTLAGLIPIKWPNGSVIKYSTTFVGFGACVDATKLATCCVSQAFATWLSLCPSSNISVSEEPANPSDLTIISISTNSDPLQFGSNDAAIERTTAVTYNSPILKCNETRADLASNGGSFPAETLINTTPLYQMHVTNVYPCNSNTLFPNCKQGTLDLCEAITHEIGHMLGLQHTFGNQPTDAQDCSPSSYSTGDIMYSTIDGNRLGKFNNCTGKPPMPSDDDICMYRKLYCPDNDAPLPHNHGTLASKENTLDMNCDAFVKRGTLVPTFDPILLAYPNPTTGTITIQFTSQRIGTVNAEIFDLLGNRLRSFTYAEQPGRDSRVLQLASLPSGHYIVRVEGINLRGSKVIVLKGK